MNWHSNLLAHIAETLSKSNIEVCAYDYKGYGKSEGLPGYLPDFSGHILDSEEFTRRVIQSAPPIIPVFVCGFSLGGLTAFHLGLRMPQHIKGVVFIAPALIDHPYFGRLNKILARLIARVFPKLIVTPANRQKSPAQRNLVVEEYLLKEDRHFYKGGLRAGTVRTVCEAMMDAETQFHKFTLPFLLFQGGLDRLVDPIVAVRFPAEVSSTDKTVVFEEQVWHGIPLEPEALKYSQQIAQWIIDRS